MPEFDGANDLDDPAHYGPVTLVRAQEKFDGNFRSIFKFKEPYALTPGSHYQLVLRVSAGGATATDAIRFTAGVYDAKNRLLNPSFESYDKTEAYLNPIACDGGQRLIHVPLTWFNSPESVPAPATAPGPEVGGFEVQAIPTQPEASWKRHAALTVHAAYLVPSQLPDAQLRADIRRAEVNTPFAKMCIWDVPLHARPEAVSIAAGPTATVMTQSVEGHTGLWGMAGEVYPKMYLESGTRQLRFKVGVEAGGAIDEAAEVGLCLYSGRRVMVAWGMRLGQAVKKEQVIPIAESGVVQEVAVVARNHAGRLVITRLDIEKNPHRGR